MHEAYGGSMAKWLERWTCNLEASGPSPYASSWIGSAVVLSSNPRPRL